MEDPIEIPAAEAPAVPELLECKEVAIDVDAYTWDEADKKMLPCHQFIQGSCEKGTTCLFYHPAAADLATAIDSPPFPEEFGTEEAMEGIVRDIGKLKNENDDGERRGRGPGRTGYVSRSERYGGQGRSAPPVHRQFSYGGYRGYRSESGSLDRNISYRPLRPRTVRPLHYFPPSSVIELDEPGQYDDRYVPPVQAEGLYIPPLMSLNSAFNEYNAPYDDFGFQDQCPDEQQFYDGESETMFSHIKWAQFLAPGQLPPPVVHIPGQYEPLVRKQGRNLLQFMTSPPGRIEAEEDIAEVAPIQEENLEIVAADGKMSAKQELKFKLGLITMELAGAELKTEVQEDPQSQEEEGADVEVIVSVPEFSEQRSPTPVAVQ